MNDSMTAHQFKIKEPNGWSTYCRTDNTLAADGVSHPDSHPPPATRGCHPPPEVLSPTFAPLHAAKPHLHLYTSRPGQPSLWAPGPLACIAASLVNVSTCQHVPSRKRVSPCPRAHMSPRDLWSRSGKFLFSDPMVRPDPVFSCLSSESPSHPDLAP